MTNAQQISFTGGFFLGGAQAVFSARKPADAVYGVSFLSNVWYDCSGPSLAVQESSGNYYATITDLDVAGTAFCGYSRSAATGLPTATRLLTHATGFPAGTTTTLDFSSTLLFPSAGIATVSLAGNPVGPAAALAQPPAACWSSYVSAPLPLPGQPLLVTVSIPSSQGLGACTSLAVTVSQSNSSAWSMQAV